MVSQFYLFVHVLFGWYYSNVPPIEDMFEKEKQKPPKFKKPLHSQLNLSETQPAHFETFLVPIGDPDMQVEWYKNGELLRAGDLIKLTLHYCMSCTSTVRGALVLYVML